MIPDVEYPYMPADRHLKYVPADHEFMLAACEARETRSGDPLFPVGIVLVKDGVIVASAGNGFNRGAGQPHICPRVVLDCPSGTGYDLCHLHDPEGHAEPMVVAEAQQLGIDTNGADAYMYGHWWACEPCWNALIGAGIRDLYVTDDAHERFSRDRVYGETLQPSVKSVYVAGPLTNLIGQDVTDVKNFYEAIAATCVDLGIDAYVPHIFGDPIKFPDKPATEIFSDCERQVSTRDVAIAEVSTPSLGTGGELVIAQMSGKKIILLSRVGSKVSRFVTGNPAVVYHLEYENYDQACQRIKNILRQL